MLDKLAGYKTQIRVLEKKLKEMDHSKLNPAKVKELTEAIQNLKNIVKEKEDKREERKKKKEEAAASKPVEASPQTPEVAKESAPAPTEVTKESTVEKFAIDSKVEPIRGTPGSYGTVIREAGVNGDPLVYVKWNEGHLKEAHGEYGAYYPSDLRLKVEAKSPTDYVPREQLYNLEADLKSNYEQSIKHLEEEVQQAKDKADYAWLGRIEQKLEDMKKAYQEKYGKTAENENGSGGTEKLKVVDMNPPYDKDPQEKATGYGGDRPMGAMVAPNSDENSLPLESFLKEAEKTMKVKYHSKEWNDLVETGWITFAVGDDGMALMKHASLDKQAINITIAEKLFVVNPLGKTAEDEYGYSVSLANGNKLFKITSKDEMGQEYLSYVIEKELANHKEAIIQKHYALYVNDSLATRTVTKRMAEKIAREKFPQAVATGTYKIVREEYPQQAVAPKMAKLVSNLAFLKKGSFVSILDVDKVKKQVKFAALDNSLRGWAPMQKFAAYGDIKQNFMDHEGHKDEIFAESGNELLVSCPAGSTNITWKTIEAPPATPESLNPDVTAAPENKNLEYIKKEVAGPSEEEKREQEEQEYIDSLMYHPASLNKDAHIRHEDGKWVIYSHDYKKKLGTYDTEAEAKKRLGQIEYFKHQGSMKPLSKKEAVQKEALENQPCDESGCNEPAVQYGRGGVWCAKHKKSFEKEADSVMETKCEDCGNELGPEVFLSKYPVCGKCIEKRRAKALGKRADQDISLEQHVQNFKDRMNAVTERLANPPAKTADLETTQDLTNVDVKDLSEGILHMVDMIESKVGENVSADPSLHPMLEEIENKVYEVEMKLGIKPTLPEHEKLEPEHSEIVKEIGEESSNKNSAQICPECKGDAWKHPHISGKILWCKPPVEEEELVEKESDMSNVPPSEPAPQGFRYAWEPTRREWIMVADPAATGTGTGGTY